MSFDAMPGSTDLGRDRRLRPLTRRALLSTGGAMALVVLAQRRTQARQGATPTAPADRASWSFTDDRGRAVTLPEPPRQVLAQINAAAALWDYGIRPTAVFGPQRLADGSPDPLAGDIDLNLVESVGEVWGDFDVEKVFALHPDLLVAPIFQEQQLWYVPAEAQAALDEQLPSVGIYATRRSIMEPIARFAELAEALGADMDSPENAAAKQELDDAVADLKAAIADKPGLTVMFASVDTESMYVANPEWMTDLIFFRELGMDIISHSVEDFWEVLSWEEAGKHPADLILVDDRTGIEDPGNLKAVETVATWRVLPAVEAGQIGLWSPEPVYSYEGFAEVLRKLTEQIRNARADVV